MVIEAVLFDWHGTLGYLKNPTNSTQVSEFLLERGYEVYPQSWDAARHYVSMVDDPKHGYSSWQEYFRQVMHRLDVEIDAGTLKELSALHKRRDTYTLFPDAVSAVKKVKEWELKTAVVTTIGRFVLQPAIAFLQQYFDTIVTGYEAGCEKSNPKMHRQTLNNLGVSPEKAVMIGDEQLVDIKIPKRLGMRTILLDRRSKIHSKPPEADALASTLTEAVTFIGGWQTPEGRQPSADS
jgi:HAD superfamily hydrolase (TIGR01549 family)